MSRPTLIFVSLAASLLSIAPSHAQSPSIALPAAVGTGAAVAIGHKGLKTCWRHPILCGTAVIGAGIVGVAIKHARDRDLELARQQEATGEAISPPGYCPDERHSFLTALVEKACKSGLAACLPADNPVELKLKAGLFKTCALARMKREDECFRGGDRGHRMQIEQMWQAHDRCQTLAGLK
jgi:hypothetical protein